MSLLNIIKESNQIWSATGELITGKVGRTFILACFGLATTRLQVALVGDWPTLLQQLPWIDTTCRSPPLNHKLQCWFSDISPHCRSAQASWSVGDVSAILPFASRPYVSWFRGRWVRIEKISQFLPLILIQFQSNFHRSVSGKSRARDPIPAPAAGIQRFLAPDPKWLGSMKIETTGVRECLFLGMQKIFAQIWSCFPQITYKQKVLVLRLKRTIVSKSRCLYV